MKDTFFFKIGQINEGHKTLIMKAWGIRCVCEYRFILLAELSQSNLFLLCDLHEKLYTVKNIMSVQIKIHTVFQTR